MREFEASRVEINKMGAEESQHDQIVAKTFNELNIGNIDVNPQEAKEMILKSNILIVPGMELKKMFLLDQVRT